MARAKQDDAAPAAVDPDQAALFPEPKLIEGPGRYRVFETLDGGWVVARAGPVCARCESCGCGEQAEPITVPALVIQVARQRMNGDGYGGLMTMLKKVTGRG
jgi:hypothetical protein